MIFDRGTACTAHKFHTHQWIKIIRGSHSAFWKWLPNEIPLRFFYSSAWRCYYF
jgi:hypothetical protein